MSLYRLNIGYQSMYFNQNVTIVRAKYEKVNALYRQ
jgi:hypothetical protein